MDYDPQSPWQMAGLTAFYSGESHYFLAVSRGDDSRRRLLLFVRNNGEEKQLLPDDGLILPDAGRLRLAAHLNGGSLQFAWAAGAETLQAVGPAVDAGILSDENAIWAGGFTGAFVGLCAIDLSGQRRSADFDEFRMTKESSHES